MSDNKDRFKFVNTEEEKDIFVEEDTSEVQVKDVVSMEEREKRAKKEKRRKYILSAIIMTIVSMLLFGFGLIWQNDTSLMAIGDALWLAFSIEFFAGWIMFVYNKNIFAPLIHGTKTFILMFVGKRTKLDYYDYMKKVEEDQIPSYYYVVIFISAAMLFVPALILLFILI